MNFKTILVVLFLLFVPIFCLGESVAGVPVLMYHKIVKEEKVPAGNCCVLPEKDFVAQIDYLKSQGYQTINTTQLYNYVTKNAPIPMKSVMLTFDDTNISDYETAFPLLKKYGYTGVFFTITDRMIKNASTTEKITEMHRAGMDIESHTVNHYYLGGGRFSHGIRSLVASVFLADKELWDSRQYLEKILNKKIKFLAWPGDSYNKKMIELAQEDGYQGLFMAKPAYTKNIFDKGVYNNRSFFNVYPADPLHLKRINMDTSVTFEMFKNLLLTGYLEY